MNPAELHTLVSERLSDLMEHFDAVQFLGSFENEHGETECITTGRGNWYSRTGMAREFLERDQSRTQAQELSDVICVEDDDT